MKIKTIDLIKMVSRFTIFSVILQTISLSVMFASTGNAQNTSLKDVYIVVESNYSSVNSVFKTIEAQTDYRFAYSKHNLTGSKNIEIKGGQRSVYDILVEISKEMKLKFTRINNSISVEKVKGKSIGIVELKTISITGNVKSADEEGLPGAAVAVKGTSLGTITDMDGNYTIEVPDENSVLIFSSLGYVSQEITVGTQTTINVTLEISDVAIDDVVITALGIKRKEKAIGYITQAVSGDDIVKSNTPNVVSSLSGKIAGVNIINANQLDGGTSRIVIRGNNNITGNNQPLIIVDGIPLENNVNIETNNSSEQTQNIVDYGTGINFINPVDIEDMNVLKGPAAAALYGARGANGVILITTKKGSKTAGIGINYSYGFKVTDPYRFREQQNKYGYGGMAMPMYTANNDEMYEVDADGNTLYPQQRWSGDRYEGIYGQMPHGLWSFDASAFTWHGYSTSWGREMDGSMLLWKDGEMKAHSPQPDNQEYFYRNGIQNTHNVSFSSGGDFGSVRIAFGQTDNNATVYNSNYQRTNFTLGSNLNISDVIKAEITTSYIDYSRLNGMDVSSDNDYFTKFIYNYPVDFDPSVPHDLYMREDGTKNNDNINHYGVDGRNVFWNIYEQNSTQQRNQLLGAIKLVYTPTDWLSFMGRTSVDYNNQEITQKNKPTDNAGLRGYYSNNLAKETVTNLDLLATAYKDNLFDNFNASFSVGGTRWHRERYGMNAETWRVVFKDPWIYSFQNYDLSEQGGNVRAEQMPKEERLEKRINSVYGFLDLSYANYLFLQLTGRNDWSSTLPTNNNSYFYPSASLSFVFSELMQQSSWFTFGKLRLAYAAAATDADPYKLLPTFESGSFAGYPTHKIDDVLPPTELKPQRSKSYETGLDLRFLDNRLRIDATYYHVVSDNQIMSAPIPVSSGYTNVEFNSGEMENKGFELIASYEIIRSNDLGLTIGWNGSKNQNKLLSLDGINESIIIGEFFGGAGPVIQVDVGEEYGNIYGWDYVLNENGNRIVEERLDGDGNVVGTLYKVTETRVKMGNSTPNLLGGVNTSLRWKNFNLYALVDYSWGADIWSGDYATSLGSGVSPETLLERDGGGLPYVYPDGTTANHGILMEGDLEDGSANTKVVHYIWKYGRLGSWGARNLSAPSILENNWIKLREVTLSYNVPQELVKKTKVFQSLRLSVTGRNLFYFYSSLPDKINPEATSLTAGNAQGLMFGALPGMRSFSFNINVGF